jgi:rubrerythrin
MVRNDPYKPDVSRYECPTCGYRVTRSDDHPGQCPDCNTDMKNIAVPRE